MNHVLRFTFILAAIAAVAAGGFRLGAGKWPTLSTVVEKTGYHMEPSPNAEAGSAAQAQETAPRRVLYWRDPDGKPAYSATSVKTTDGRDYVPVYENEELPLPGDKPGEPAKEANAKTEGGEKKILYYRNPMGLPDTSSVPKKDWMGMDYIPVYEGEDEGGASAVKVSLDKVQRAGVRTEEARMITLAKSIHAPGIAKPDERTLRAITLRADAFIEKLYVNQLGQHVVAGQPLFRVYSPEFLRALVEAKSSSIAGVIGAEQKLRILEIPPQAIADAKKATEISPSFDFPSPASGVVMEKNIVEGMMMRMGEPLYRLVDLSSIWVIANIAEQDLADIAIGDPAKVHFKALPGETFDGKVTFILHELDKETRTASVRIEVKNPDHRIKHEMYADVEIDAGASDAPRLAVPEQAVIDSGKRQVVLVARGEGRFEPRAVQIGRRGNGMIEITDGLKDGETIVVSANFLIDAESNLKAALAAFTADAPQPMPDARKEPAR